MNIYVTIYSSTYNKIIRVSFKINQYLQIAILFLFFNLQYHRNLSFWALNESYLTWNNFAPKLSLLFWTETFFRKVKEQTVNLEYMRLVEIKIQKTLHEHARFFVDTELY